MAQRHASSSGQSPEREVNSAGPVLSRAFVHADLTVIDPDDVKD